METPPFQENPLLSTTPYFWVIFSWPPSLSKFYKQDPPNFKGGNYATRPCPVIYCTLCESNLAKFRQKLLCLAFFPHSTLPFDQKLQNSNDDFAEKKKNIYLEYTITWRLSPSSRNFCEVKGDLMESYEQTVSDRVAQMI